MDREAELERYLHARIPLAAAMEVSVRSATFDAVVLSAPLGPNINHMGTVFGGSASALGILAAWSLLHVRLMAEGLACDVVIQANEMDYDLPIDDAFTARSGLVDPAAWPLFLKTLARRKRARIEVQSSLLHHDAVAGRFKGKFVALLRDAA